MQYCFIYDLIFYPTHSRTPSKILSDFGIQPSLSKLILINKGVKLVSTLQLRQGLAHNELTLILVLMVEDESSSEAISMENQWLLKKYRDIRLESLTKGLFSLRGIDNEIDLLSEVKLSAINMCRTTQPKLVKWLVECRVY